MTIFNNQFVYTTYADDTAFFFFSNKNFVIEIIQIFENFSIFSGSKANKSMCEIASVGVLKLVQMVSCGMAYVNLKTNAIKNLRIHFSYKRRLENDENSRKYIIKIEELLKLWRMSIFKTLEFQFLKL